MKKIIMILSLLFVMSLSSNAVTINHYSFERDIPTIEPTSPMTYGSVQIKCAVYFQNDGQPRESCRLNCNGGGATECEWSTATSCDCDENVGPSDVLDRIVETESDDLFDYAEDQVYNHSVLNGSYNANIIKLGITYNRTVSWTTNTTTNKTTININITKIAP